MSGIVCQTVLAAAQFDGNTAATGLFIYTNHNTIPRTSRVVVLTLSYVELQSGPALTTGVSFRAMKPGGLPTEYIPLGDATAAGGLLDADGTARLKLCGIVLPREPGDGGAFWEIRCITSGKTQTATVCADSVICPYPDTDERDSAEV